MKHKSIKIFIGQLKFTNENCGHDLQKNRRERPQLSSNGALFCQMRTLFGTERKFLVNTRKLKISRILIYNFDQRF